MNGHTSNRVIRSLLVNFIRSERVKADLRGYEGDTEAVAYFEGKIDALEEMAVLLGIDIAKRNN